MPKPSFYLPPTDFNKDSAAWTDAVSLGTSLLSYFTNSSKPEPVPSKLQYVVFSVEDMITLVSTVGARYIRAQFVVLPAKLGGVPFSVVLYALDSQRGRISAYYVGGVTPGSMKAIPLPEQELASDPNGNGELPLDLVQSWIGGWQELADIDTDMFNTNYGPLQGYVFELADFIDPLFPGGLTKDHELRVYFGLHSYQVTSANDTRLTATVGLILSVQKESTTSLPVTYRRNAVRLLDSNGNSLNDGDDGFYDLSHPNPPGAPPASN